MTPASSAVPETRRDALRVLAHRGVHHPPSPGLAWRNTTFDNLAASRGPARQLADGVIGRPRRRVPGRRTDPYVQLDIRVSFPCRLTRWPGRARKARVPAEPRPGLLQRSQDGSREAPATASQAAATSRSGPASPARRLPCGRLLAAGEFVPPAVGGFHRMPVRTWAGDELAGRRRSGARREAQHSCSSIILNRSPDRCLSAARGSGPFAPPAGSAPPSCCWRL